ncbi:unnamed protein product [Didymodactylos carnosus]|uniref:Uncharacterized protein n=1 Tax=Didymodactylos carnosus TaxID=1234261 RepID=A0A813UVA5_9BILA|nr:unnamed protein product [Didymodactylos carnosus]CAF0887746.1 unnamed protein product [Didymodactylos carnosus]CAF3615628.1 unnamed protein product [Didymodactylos carnosus]CAF3670522.1 unnamed protein product [Didymodactylos carnosus]
MFDSMAQSENGTDMYYERGKNSLANRLALYQKRDNDKAQIYKRTIPLHNQHSHMLTEQYLQKYNAAIKEKKHAKKQAKSNSNKTSTSVNSQDEHSNPATSSSTSSSSSSSCTTNRIQAEVKIDIPCNTAEVQQTQVTVSTTINVKTTTNNAQQQNQSIDLKSQVNHHQHYPMTSPQAPPSSYSNYTQQFSYQDSKVKSNDYFDDLFGDSSQPSQHQIQHQTSSSSFSSSTSSSPIPCSSSPLTQQQQQQHNYKQPSMMCSTTNIISNFEHDKNLLLQSPSDLLQNIDQQYTINSRKIPSQHYQSPPVISNLIANTSTDSNNTLHKQQHQQQQMDLHKDIFSDCVLFNGNEFDLKAYMEDIDLKSGFDDFTLPLTVDTNISAFSFSMISDDLFQPASLIGTLSNSNSSSTPYSFTTSCSSSPSPSFRAMTQTPPTGQSNDTNKTLLTTHLRTNMSDSIVRYPSSETIENIKSTLKTELLSKKEQQLSESNSHTDINTNSQSIGAYNDSFSNPTKYTTTQKYISSQNTSTTYQQMQYDDSIRQQQMFEYQQRQQYEQSRLFAAQQQTRAQEYASSQYEMNQYQWHSKYSNGAVMTSSYPYPVDQSSYRQSSYPMQQHIHRSNSIMYQHHPPPSQQQRQYHHSHSSACYSSQTCSSAMQDQQKAMYNPRMHRHLSMQQQQQQQHNSMSTAMPSGFSMTQTGITPQQSPQIQQYR